MVSPPGRLSARFCRLPPHAAAFHNAAARLPARAPPLELVSAAVTARSALEAADLERLETLGDAFLKYAVRLGGASDAPSICASLCGRAWARACALATFEHSALPDHHATPAGVCPAVHRAPPVPRGPADQAQGGAGGAGGVGGLGLAGPAGAALRLLARAGPLPPSRLAARSHSHPPTPHPPASHNRPPTRPHQELVVANVHLAEAAVKVGRPAACSAGRASVLRARERAVAGQSVVLTVDRLRPHPTRSWGWTAACACCPSACATWRRPPPCGCALLGLGLAAGGEPGGLPGALHSFVHP